MRVSLVELSVGIRGLLGQWRTGDRVMWCVCTIVCV